LTHQLSRVTTRKTVTPLLHTLERAEITEDCMNDPLAPEFMHDIWERVAENNTKIYRQVFRTMPDSEVLDWDDYKRFNDYNERFMQSQGLGHSKPKVPKDAPPRSGPPGSAGTDSMITQIIDEKASKPKGLFANLTNKARPSSKRSNESHPQSHELNEKSGESPASGISRAPTAVPTPDDRPLDEKDFVKEADANQQKDALTEGPLSLAPQTSKSEPTQPEDSAFDRRRTITIAADLNDAPETTATQSNTTNGAGLQHATSRKGRRRATTKSSARPPIMAEEVMSKEEAEELLNMIQGHLVVFPYDW
jgi:phospholipase D1/2